MKIDFQFFKNTPVIEVKTLPHNPNGKKIYTINASTYGQQQHNFDGHHYSKKMSTSPTGFEHLVCVDWAVRDEGSEEKDKKFHEVTRNIELCEGYMSCPNQECPQFESTGERNIANYTARKKTCRRCGVKMQHHQCIDKSLPQEKVHMLKEKTRAVRRIIVTCEQCDTVCVLYSGFHSCKAEYKPGCTLDKDKYLAKFSTGMTVDRMRENRLSEAIANNEPLDQVCEELSNTPELARIRREAEKNMIKNENIMLDKINELNPGMARRKKELNPQNPGKINENCLYLTSSEKIKAMIFNFESARRDEAVPTLSLDGNESRLERYSILSVSIYSCQHEKVISIGDFLTPKPGGETSENIELLLTTIHKDMMSVGYKDGLSGKVYFTTDKSAAIIKGIRDFGWSQLQCDISDQIVSDTFHEGRLI